MNTFIFDVEATGLLHDKPSIHCLCSNIYAPITDNYSSLPDRLKKDGVRFMVGHNLLGYDLPLLKLYSGIDYELSKGVHLKWGSWSGIVIDTLTLSGVLNPDRVGGHGLEAWSKRLGTFKPEIGDWENLPLPVYIDRAEHDVTTTVALLEHLLQELSTIYRCSAKLSSIKEEVLIPVKIEQQFLDITTRQAITGVPFDNKAAKDLVAVLDNEATILEEKWEPQLPDVATVQSNLQYPPKQQFLAPPKQQFKKSGGPNKPIADYLAKVGLTPDDVKLPITEGLVPTGKFLDWLSTHGYSYDQHNRVVKKDGKSYSLPLTEATNPTHQLKLDNNPGMKDYLIREYGWVPLHWNYKTDKAGRKVRDTSGRLIKTSPKIKDDAGNICENLESLEVPFVKDFVRYTQMKHKRHVLLSKDGSGGLSKHPRLLQDGRLPAEVIPIGTNTRRVAHRIVANIPRPGSFLGDEMRSLFYAPPGWYMVGYDASKLEACCEAHYVVSYPGGEEYVADLMSGHLHDRNSEQFGCPYATAKAIKYALTYGAGVPRISALLGREATAEYHAFWENAAPLALFRDECSRKWGEGLRSIRTIDGAVIPVRAEHKIVNTYFQSAGAIVMKLSACIMDDKIRGYGDKVQKIIDYHDEAQYLVHESLVEDDGEQKTCVIGELGVQSIAKAAMRLGFKVPLTGDYKVGKNWGETH